MVRFLRIIFPSVGFSFWCGVLCTMYIEMFRFFFASTRETSCRMSAIWFLLRIVHIKIIKTDAIGPVYVYGAADVFQNVGTHTAAYNIQCYSQSLSHEHIFS